MTSQLLQWKQIQANVRIVTDLPFYVLFRLFVGRQWT
jgi:hypothetical protein